MTDNSNQTKIKPIQLLLDDHKRIKGLFRQFEAVDERAPEMKAGVVREIAMELEIHSKVEEELFYPALQNNGNQAQALLVDACIHEHQGVDQLVSKLRNLRAHSVETDLVMREIILRVQEHVETEERELFPVAEGLGFDLGARMLERRRELLASPEYREARPEVVQDPNGGEQMRKKHVA